MSDNWEQRPFQLACGSLKNTETETKLPFSIGSVSRQGFEHIRCGISNQDAITIKINDDFMIAVLCDGCTSHDESLITDYSSNEVGSRLLAEFVANFCYQDSAPRKNRMKINPFLNRLNTEVHQRLKRLMKVLLVKGEHQLPFLFSMMTSTIIVTVIRKKEFFVFHCGDGFVGVNNEIYDLNSTSGSYLTNAFDPRFNSNNPLLLKLITSGNTSELNHIYMATDGFEKSQILESSFFKKVLHKQNHPHTGYIDLLGEIHLEIIEPYYQKNKPIRQWPIDDASLVMIRKTIK